MIRNNNSKINRKRIYFLFILFLIGFSVITYRIVSIQYIYAIKYKSYADYQHKNENIINSKRGKLMDRNGTELAVSLIEKTVYANPKMIVDIGYESKALAEVLDLDAEYVREKLGKNELGFVYIKRQIDAETAELINMLNLPGIYIQDETKRYYPQGELAASIIGFTGLDNNGLSGIELEYEKYLRGVDGRQIFEKDVFGKIIPGGENNYIQPINGSDITLTIDSQIQFIAEQRLKKVVLDYNAIGAIAIVMNPDNGEVYAIASYPGFDLNNYQDYSPELYKNFGISFTYEPGSTFKIIDVASALDNNCVGCEQMFSLPPSIKVGDRVIKEIFRTYNIDYSVKEIIQHSSNVGAVTVALSMGEKIFWENIKKFGFGEITGIDLPGEEKGLFYDYKTWPASTIGALAIGQNISVTPLQLLRAVCCVANGGYLVTPYIVSEIELQNSKIEFQQLKEKNRIISKVTAEAVKDMMRAVVESGTGHRAQIEGISICGKTGTAEKVNRSGRGYDEGRVMTSFVGFAPFDDPEVAIIVVVDEPHGGTNEIWGGTVAAPVFKDIMEFSLRKLGVCE